MPNYPLDETEANKESTSVFLSTIIGGLAFIVLIFGGGFVVSYLWQFQIVQTSIGIIVFTSLALSAICFFIVRSRLRKTGLSGQWPSRRLRSLFIFFEGWALAQKAKLTLVMIIWSVSTVLLFVSLIGVLLAAD